MPPSNFKCACCGDESGYTLQLPWNVFETAYRAKGRRTVECVLAMATMLERKQMTAVLKRVTVCKKVSA